MTYDKKLVEDWLCEHFPYHLRVNKDIPKDAYVMIKSEMLMSQGWLWIDNPLYDPSHLKLLNHYTNCLTGSRCCI